MEPHRPGWPLWTWWTLVVLAVSAPLPGFTAEPQWDRINWIPFADPHDKPTDVAGNIALYIPFGFSFVRHRRGPTAIVYAAAAAGTLAVCAEALQIFSTVRDPSATDVASAVVGAVVGGVVGTRRG